MATLGQQAVGTTVKIQLGGALKDFIIVHQGYPSSLYDSSCNGTWVLQKEIPRKYKWYNDNNDHYNTYPGSYMDTYANNEYFNSIEADIRNRIKQVKIPYTLYGYRDPSTGANGHPVKVFPLSAWEIGATGDFRSKVDGSRLAYFDATNEASSKRVATYNGSAAAWWTRSPTNGSFDYVVSVNADGSLDEYERHTSPNGGYRFAFILPSDLYLDSGGHVITNTPPVISGSNGNLGTFGDTPPSYQYTVTDAQGGAVSVQEKLDNVVKRTYSVSLGSQNNFTISASDWRSVLNGNHTMAVTASDSQGASSTRSMTLIKNVTSLGFTLSSPMVADAMPDRCVINIQGNFPGGSTLKVEICNNGYDSSPTWEDITIQAQNGQKYFFTNKAKTASQWGVNLRVSLNRGSSSEPCYVSSIGGNFE